MSVWICKASATCDNCDVEYYSNNAVSLMAKHCKKTGHTGEVTVCYGVDSGQQQAEIE